MANHRAAAALLLIASLFVVVAFSGADARPTVGPNKMPDLRHDARGQDDVTDATAPAVSELKPTCDDGSEEQAPEPPPCDDDCGEPKPEPPTCDNNCEGPKPEPPTCDDNCEEPKPEPKSELTCNKVHGVQEGETCYCLSQGEGLTLDDFLGFNPNICCDNLFIGQWVCLDATSGCHD